MMKKLLVFFALLLASPAFAQNVQQSGTVTARHPMYWVTSGVAGDPGGATDSALSSLGVTNEGGPGLCVSSQRASAAGRNQLCFGVSTAGAATISLQNFGTAAAQNLQFVINGVTFPFPGSLANITIGTTPVISGTNGQCLFVSGGVVGQQTCTLSAITSLIGDVTATGPGVSTATLGASGVAAGTYGSATLVPIITVDAKGRVTAVTTIAPSVTVGSTVVISGTTNGLLYANGSVLGNLATLSSGVLVTNAGGVPLIATTLPSALTIPSPTFTGTETFPDAATWTSGGISKAVALSIGSATLPSAGNVSISGQYQVNGTAISASTLSNGVTGTGAVVLAASPTLSGTIAGNLTWSGNITYTAQSIETGTSAPASAAGNTVTMGTIASPTLTNTGQAFYYNTVVNGAVFQGDGSTNDVSILNKNGTLVFGVPTGTAKLNFPGLISGTCSAGLAVDAGNNLIEDSCPGAAASVQVGTTTITSGTNGGCLYSNGGTLGNHPCITEAQGRITLTANTPVMVASASAQTTLRYDCYNGNQVPYFDGTQDNIDTVASCEVTDAMVSAASAGQVVINNVYDVWWVHSGANHICLAMSAAGGGGGGWSSDTAGSNTARGTGYSQLDRTTRPYATNKNALANCFNGATNYGSVSANQATYLGTIYATANGQTSYIFGTIAANWGTATFGVWNMYNRVSVSTFLGDTTDSWTYAVANTWRAPNGNTTTARATIVRGLDEDSTQAEYSAEGSPGAATNIAPGIGLDSTSAYTGTTQFLSIAANNQPGIGKFSGLVGAGLHFLSAIEFQNTTTSSTWYGDAGSPAYIQTGIQVTARQ